MPPCNWMQVRVTTIAASEARTLARDTAAWRCPSVGAVSSAYGRGRDRRTGQRNLDLHIDRAMLQRLEAADLAAELLARLHVVERDA